MSFPLDKIVLESVDSTNSYLKRIIKESGLSQGVAIMAKHQSSGRGRLGRSWLSAEGNTLCMSIGVKNMFTDGFTLLAALAVYKALKRFCPELDLQVKWPNDIICNNKKLCGILCEGIGEYTVIGIGINVNDKSFDKEIEQKATSLFLLSGREFKVEAVFSAVIEAFENVLTGYDFAFNAKAKEDYEKLCANIGKEVFTENTCGKAVGISEDGSLMLEVDGKAVKIFAGEVAVHGIY